MTETLLPSPTAVRVADVMSAPAIAVPPTTSLWAAWRIMIHCAVRHLVVADDGRCVGIVDDRALFAQWPMGPLALRRHGVEEIMRVPRDVVTAADDLSVVAELMARENVDAVPVVTDDGTILGVVTSTDITVAVAAHGVHANVRKYDDAS